MRDADVCPSYGPAMLGCWRKRRHEGLCAHVYSHDGDSVRVEWCFDCLSYACDHMDEATKLRLMDEKIKYDILHAQWLAWLRSVSAVQR